MKENNKMRKIKKLAALLITLSMIMGISLTSLACTPSYDVDMPEIPEIKVDLDSVMESIRENVRDMQDKESRSTTAYLSTNEITDCGNRAIKINWEPVDDAVGYEIQIADNEEFENAEAVMSKRSDSVSYTFASVPGDVKDTFFLRVRPKFKTTITDDGFCYGQWSNVIVAEYNEKVVEKPVEADIKWLPKLDKSVWERLSKIDWSKISRR